MRLGGSVGAGPVRVGASGGCGGPGCLYLVLIGLALTAAVWAWPIALGLILFFAAATASNDDEQQAGPGCLIAGAIAGIAGVAGRIAWIMFLTR